MNQNLERPADQGALRDVSVPYKSKGFRKIHPVWGEIPLEFESFGEDSKRTVFLFFHSSNCFSEEEGISVDAPIELSQLDLPGDGRRAAVLL